MKTTHLLTLLLSSLLSLPAITQAQAQVQTNINYQYDQNGNRVQRLNQLYTDLSPVFYFRPFNIIGQTPVSAVVEIYELNGLPTTGPITLRITRDPHIVLALNPNLTSLQNRPVQNAQWSLDATNPYYYTLTSTSIVPAGGVLAVGLTGTLIPASTSGSITLSTVLLQGSGEIKLTNNGDSEVVYYTPQAELGDKLHTQADNLTYDHLDRLQEANHGELSGSLCSKYYFDEAHRFDFTHNMCYANV